MRRYSKRFPISITLVIVVFLLLSGNGLAEEKERYFEIGLGGGVNIEAVNTKQVLLAPALNWKIKGSESLRFRLEGNLEFIKDDKNLVVVGGVAPFLRLCPPNTNVRPFFEVGVGANLSSRDEIGGRRLGGTFVFSLMGGVGLEFVKKEYMISLSYRFRHLSNAHLYPTNQGMNFQYAMVSVGF